MIRTAALVVAALYVLPAAAFTPQMPTGAEQTASQTDPAGRHGVAVGAAGPKSGPPLRSLEGTRTRIAWRSDTLGPDALVQALAEQLRAEAFTPIHDCDADACGGFAFRTARPVLPMPDMFVSLGDFQYRAFARAAPEALASVLASQTPGGAYVQLTLISTEAPPTAAPAEAAPETVPAAAERGDGLAQALDQEGRAVLPGLDFAPGDAALAGAPVVLAQLASWLAADAARRIALVGHSDWTGAVQANVALSRARAQSVADALIAAGADRARITVTGIGPYAPRASNMTEAGRAANRRVEAVVLPAR